MIGSVKISNDDFGEMEVISHRCKKKSFKSEVENLSEAI